MNIPTITIIGGGGFVGSHICYALAKQNCQIRVITRQAAKYKHLTLIPNLTLLQIDPHHPQMLSQALAHTDIVINCIGILNESRKLGHRFSDVHVTFNKNLVKACQLQKVKQLIFISGLGADASKAESRYLRSKGEAENILLQANNPELHVTCLRPSIIFGPGDSFFTRFASLLKISFGAFCLPCATSHSAPVFVGDVVDIILACIDNRETYGQRYDICGPVIYTLKDLVKYTAKIMQKRILIVGLFDWMSMIAGHILQKLPGKPFSYDNYLSARAKPICQHPLADSLPAPHTTIKAIVPKYIGKNALVDPMEHLRQQASPHIK